MRKLSFSDHFEYPKPFEYCFDPFERDFERPERKLSFVDLTSGCLSYPEVRFTQTPSLDQVPPRLEELSEVPCGDSARTDLRTLDDVMPEFRTLKPQPKRVVKTAPFLRTPAASNRMVGGLTLEQRQEKLQKYFAKKKRRTFAKKIAYDCRKKVADKRLRIRGRFVTKEQAIAILGRDNEFVKNLLSDSAN